jgi:general secretion pathway protein G
VLRLIEGGSGARISGERAFPRHRVMRHHGRMSDHLPAAGGAARSPRAISRPALRVRSRTSGFTLIEVIVVIVVIAILATLVAPNVFRHVGAAKSATAQSQVEMLGAALDAYRLDVGHYPTTAEGLNALQVTPAGATAWRGPYLRKAVPNDPWAKPYVYVSPGQVNPTGYDLVTYGADGRPGGEGDDADVKSW